MRLGPAQPLFQTPAFATVRRRKKSFCAASQANGLDLAWLNILRLAMVVTTQLQTMNPFSLLRGQDARPPKVTFWGQLDADEKKASVDTRESWAFGEKLAWDPAGRVKDEWNNSIYPQLFDFLKVKISTIFRGVRNQCLWKVACWMVGPAPDAAQPAAVIGCKNKKVTKNIVKLLEKHCQLSSWGFCVYGHESNVEWCNGDFVTDSGHRSTLCGSKFVTGDGFTITNRISTVGGIVLVSDVPYMMAALHPFKRQPQSEAEEKGASCSPSSGGSDTDYEDDGEESYSDVGPYEGNRISLDSDQAIQKHSQSGDRDLGNIPPSSSSSFYSSRMDWALLKPKFNLDSYHNAIHLRDEVIIPSKVSTELSAGQQLWLKVERKSTVQTQASPTICGLFLPGSGLRNVWALHMAPDLGDCGSWVVDSTTDSLFAVIVAGAVFEKITYALPARNVFQDIRVNFPKAHLRLPIDNPYPAGLFETERLERIMELGDDQICEKLTIQDIDISQTTSNGDTLLCLAIKSKRYRLVEKLLEFGANVFHVNQIGDSALYLAVESQSLEITRLLLKGPGVDTERENQAGPGPYAPKRSISSEYQDLDIALSIAVKEGDELIVGLLIAAGSDVSYENEFGETPLFLAIQERHISIVKILIAWGADASHRSRTGDTPLLLATSKHKFLGEGLAALKYDEEIVKILLQAGADVSHSDRYKVTPLLAAARNQYGTRWMPRTVGFSTVKPVEMLLEAGANVNDQTQSGMTPLHMAAQNTDRSAVDILEVLLDAGANVSAQDQFGMTPLHTAAQAYDLYDPQSISKLKLLLRACSNISARNTFGKTPLHLATESSDPSVVEKVKILLGAGAKVSDRDRLGRTPLHTAIQVYDPSPEIVSLLLDAGANVDKQDESGKTPLHLATQGYSPSRAEIVTMLLQNNADVSFQDKFGRTPLHLASRNYSPKDDIVKILLNAAAVSGLDIK